MDFEPTILGPVIALAVFALAVLGLDILIARTGNLAAGVSAQIMAAAIALAVFQNSPALAMLVAYVAAAAVALLTLGGSSRQPLLPAVKWIVLLLAGRSLFGTIKPSGYSSVNLPWAENSNVELLISLSIIPIATTAHHYLTTSLLGIRLEACAWGPFWHTRFLGPTHSWRILGILIGTAFVVLAAALRVGSAGMVQPTEPWLRLSFEILIVYFLAQTAARRFTARPLSWLQQMVEKQPRFAILETVLRSYSLALVSTTICYILLRDWALPLLLQGRFEQAPEIVALVSAVSAICIALSVTRWLSPPSAFIAEFPPTEVDRDFRQVDLEVIELALPFLDLPPITTRFRSGQVHVISGANGCGKSTFFQCLAGVQVPRSGRTAVRDSAKERERASSRGIGDKARMVSLFLPQSSRLVPPASPLALARLLTPDYHEPLPDTRCEYLSTGTRRLAEIYLSLLKLAQSNSPPVVLLDEPLAGLDTERTPLVIDTITRLVCKGHLVLIAEHRRIVEQLKASGLRMKIWLLNESGLSCLRNGPQSNKEQPRRILSQASRTRQNKGDLLLRKATVAYSGKPNILSVPYFVTNFGEIAVIRGDNGSGKSCFLKALVGFGAVLSGEYIFRRSAVPRTRVFVSRFRQTDIVLLPEDDRWHISGFTVTQHFSLIGSQLRSYEYLLKVGNISGTLRPPNLSGGQKRWFGLVLTFARAEQRRTPTIVLLDEPFSGLSDSLKKRALSLLTRLSELGHGVVVVDHELDLIGQQHAAWEIRKDLASLPELRLLPP